MNSASTAIAAEAADSAAVAPAAPVEAQPQLFAKRILDRLAAVGAGVTAPWWVRADDGLCYIVKDDAPPQAPHVRASEFIWSSVARLVGLPAPAQEIIEDESTGRTLVASRREQGNIGRDHATCVQHLLGGKIVQGGRQLSRIYAFDLFCGNWDRHPGNYLILDEAGTLAVFAIDFSHVALHPGLSGPQDPLTFAPCATRAMFKPLVQPYGADGPASIDILERLDVLPVGAIETILTGVPQDWLATDDRDQILAWWQGSSRTARTAQLKQGFQDGTYP